MKQEADKPYYERFLYRNATALLVLALLYGVESFRYFWGLELNAIYFVVRKILGFGIVILLLPSVIRVVYQRWKNRGGCASYEDDFLLNTYKNACVHGFTFLVIVLIAIQATAVPYLNEVPLQVLVKTVLSLTFIILSLAFFYQLRDTDGEADDIDDEDAA
jgi:hypothetical protein